MGSSLKSLMLVFVLGTLGCGEDSTDASNINTNNVQNANNVGNVDWTIGLYMAADNALGNRALATLGELELPNSTELFVFVDFPDSMSPDTVEMTIEPGDAVVLKLEGKTWQVVEVLGEVNSVAPETMADFAVRLSERPSSKKGLVLWGEGSESAFGSDDTSNGQRTPVHSYAEAIAGRAIALDFVGFDAPLMASASVLPSMVNVTDIVIAQPGFRPVGWDLNLLMKTMADSQTTEDGAEAFVTAFVKSLRNQRVPLDCTVGAWRTDFTRLREALATVQSDMNRHYMSNPLDGFKTVAPAVKSSEIYWEDHHNIHLIDMRDFYLGMQSNSPEQLTSAGYVADLLESQTIATANCFDEDRLGISMAISPEALVRSDENEDYWASIEVWRWWLFDDSFPEIESTPPDVTTSCLKDDEDTGPSISCEVTANDDSALREVWQISGEVLRDNQWQVRGASRTIVGVPDAQGHFQLSANSPTFRDGSLPSRGFSINEVAPIQWTRGSQTGSGIMLGRVGEELHTLANRSSLDLWSVFDMQDDASTRPELQISPMLAMYDFNAHRFMFESSDVSLELPLLETSFFASPDQPNVAIIVTDQNENTQTAVVEEFQ